MTNKSPLKNSQKKYSPLINDKASDVGIVGAGITGLLMAYTFTKKGYRVTVLEKNQPALSETQQSVTHLSDILDEGLSRMVHVHGLEKTREIVQSHRWGIHQIEKIITDENLDCDFEYLPGILLKSQNTSFSYLEEEVRVAKLLGSIEFQLLSNEDEYFTSPRIQYARQATMDLQKFCQELLRVITKLGAEIYGDSEVVSHEDGSLPHLRVANGSTLYCKHIIYCTNQALHNRVTNYNNQAVFKSYVLKMALPKNTIPKALIWDTSLPYHYGHIQSESSNDFLILGGEDQMEDLVSDPAEKFSLLQDWCLTELGLMGEVTDQWVGKIIETADGLGYIGRPLGCRNVYIVNGDSGQGVTQAAVATWIMSNLIEKKDHVWIHIYAPFRFKIKSYNKRVETALRAAKLFKNRIQHRSAGYEKNEYAKTSSTTEKGTKSSS